MAETNYAFNDALALEYQSHYGTARRDLDVFDLVNNPSANGVCRIFGLDLKEKGLDSLIALALLRVAQRWSLTEITNSMAHLMALEVVDTMTATGRQPNAAHDAPQPT